MADLISITELKLHLPINSSDTSKDLYLQSLIKLGSDHVRRITHRAWAAATIDIVEKFTPTINIELLQVKYFPIISITSVVENGVTLTEDSDYFVNYAIGQFKRLNETEWIEKDHGVVITYKGGEEPPDGLKLLVINWIASISGERTRTFTTEDGVEQAVTITTIPKWVTDGLEYYTKVLI